MKRNASIEAQIGRAEKLLPNIESEYSLSLTKKSIGDDLKLDIQAFCGHLRAALDYIAKDIVETHCPKANPKANLYFPIASDVDYFTTLMNKSYPELEANCKAVYDILAETQPYIGGANSWLSNFNKVNNENKHNDLVEQTKTETKRVDVQTQGGGSVNWDPSSVKFGSGVKIGGVPVDPATQMPVPSSTQQFTVQTWVDFRFDGVNVSALGLLKETLPKVRLLFQNIYQCL